MGKEERKRVVVDGPLVRHRHTGSWYGPPRSVLVSVVGPVDTHSPGSPWESPVCTYEYVHMCVRHDTPCRSSGEDVGLN